ncbi:fasciclin domain-containing protein [Haliscomenobacter hydrossis]|uniref:Beta-Ig-H3/fasciclin n=1 Tax=Haliscomenobacter hydrossis (strain ATCC 27775 / DSM 1100 / LMG 10767 / O) TaxID=760192 RepID=F4KV69_HALH1|nr:fasciclin domain-containing protein [Haliscomenobacter hydrossis]AEE49235.1 beta-Ig-H3/fasciclin [Haliscomenobacter hydrossis DSM 1100]
MRLFTSAILGCLLMSLATSCGSSAAIPQMEDFNAVLKKVGNTTTYQMLIATAGGMPQLLGDKVKGTLIVPTDDAFNQLGGQALMDLMDAQKTADQMSMLKKHVLNLPLSPKKLAAMGSVTTVEGTSITVKNESNVLSFGDAKVISSWQTEEGMVYIVNKVIK